MKEEYKFNHFFHPQSPKSHTQFITICQSPFVPFLFECNVNAPQSNGWPANEYKKELLYKEGMKFYLNYDFCGSWALVKNDCEQMNEEKLEKLNWFSPDQSLCICCKKSYNQIIDSENNQCESFRFPIEAPSVSKHKSVPFIDSSNVGDFCSFDFISRFNTESARLFSLEFPTKLLVVDVDFSCFEHVGIDLNDNNLLKNMQNIASFINVGGMNSETFTQTQLKKMSLAFESFLNEAARATDTVNSALNSIEKATVALQNVGVELKSKFILSKKQ